ncbi:MAG TPA: ArsR family transcriptional regulator [Candidatus Bathyarchaeia archaeon]
MKEFCNEAYYMIFSTLANRTRLAIIDALRTGPKTVSEIKDIFEQDETLISENLKPLVNCALVLPEISEKEKKYSLNKEIIEPLSELLAFHVDKYCPGFKECIPPEKLKEYMKAEAAKTTYIEH